MTVPGGQSDGLVRPLNAPSGQQVLPGVQPGVTGGVVLASYVIVYGSINAAGTGPGLFIYNGSPGPGNPPVLSDTLATQDPYGNAIAPGIWAGQYGGIQAGLDINPATGYGQVLLPTGAASEALAGGLAAAAIGGGSIVQFFSPQDASPASDRIILQLGDNASSAPASATWFMVYNDPSGAPHTQVAGNYQGVFLDLIAGLTAVMPGTGTSTTNSAQPETWHVAGVGGAPALINGWAGSGSGVNGLRYRLTPESELEIEADIINATFAPPGNSVCLHLPAGWIPGTSRNRPAAWNNPQANNSASPPWVNVNGGAIQLTGIEAANKEIFFHIWVPM